MIERALRVVMVARHMVHVRDFDNSIPIRCFFGGRHVDASGRTRVSFFRHGDFLLSYLNVTLESFEQKSLWDFIGFALNKFARRRRRIIVL